MIKKKWIIIPIQFVLSILFYYRQRKVSLVPLLVPGAEKKKNDRQHTSYSVYIK